PPRRHDGAQAVVYRWLPVVRAELGVVRPCAKPPGAHRLSRPARDRRGAAVVEQRRLVVAAAGPARRGRALGILSAAQAVGLSTGPALGGLVLDLLDWRWVFWINVPVGLAGTVLGWFLLPP